MWEKKAGHIKTQTLAKVEQMTEMAAGLKRQVRSRRVENKMLSAQLEELSTSVNQREQIRCLQSEGDASVRGYVDTVHDVVYCRTSLCFCPKDKWITHSPCSVDILLKTPGPPR